MKKKLRSGYTTGACAAAAAKAAAAFLLSGVRQNCVEIPFPDGKRVSFAIHRCEEKEKSSREVYASVIKDAGDDPDVTNGAEIGAIVRKSSSEVINSDNICITGGSGVGTVTKAGLAVAIGQPAINPVPRLMISSAVQEAMNDHVDCCKGLHVEITVVDGENLAEKTLNKRLGIIGGLSILGTTGIVKPISAEAWTATITASMQVAKANNVKEIVLSTGRTSEKAIQEFKGFRPEAHVEMGDYLEFALLEAAKFNFEKVHVSGMWAKILKAAMEIPQTHVRFGALEMDQAVECIQNLTPDIDLSFLSGVNTAREIYDRLSAHKQDFTIKAVCKAAQRYEQEKSGLPVVIYLVHYNGKIVYITD